METIVKNTLSQLMLNTTLETKAFVPWSLQKKIEIGIQNQFYEIPEVLVLSTYPPRECGIATYTQDLIEALEKKFGNSFSFKICALQNGITKYDYPDKVTFTLDTTDSEAYFNLAVSVNESSTIQSVLIQHEFGLFGSNNEFDLHKFLHFVNKPVVVVFHTVLPRPNIALLENVKNIVSACVTIVVMTHDAAKILENDYKVDSDKITVIPHGTHLVPHLSKEILKEKYGLKGRKVLTTFGLLSSGKGIETTLAALPSIIEVDPEVLFLIIGKTHPSVVKSEGEKYRGELETKVNELALSQNVKFVNKYLALPELLEYLQLTDIYLFTSKDPNQAVSGTFAYAMSCACPIISTPIPHAIEVLKDNTGIIVDFQNSDQLSIETIKMLKDEKLRMNISTNTLQKSILTAWENSSVAHAYMFEKMGIAKKLNYTLPPINLTHIHNMTTDFGMIQFSKINQPDLESGYTLDDNVRALIAMCLHFELTKNKEDLFYIQLYLDFIEFCVTPSGSFLNYVDENKAFTSQNEEVNLSDSNGRAIWALGFLISKNSILPSEIQVQAEQILFKVIPSIEKMHSTRAMAFAIKGLCYCIGNTSLKIPVSLIKLLADRLVNMYKHESEQDWEWFEGYLTYGNSVLPEALLDAWQVTGDETYKEIALTSFSFLLKNTFNEDGIRVISNRSWWKKGQKVERYGEQPIEIAYTILTLDKFYQVFEDKAYYRKMKIAFNWFLGKNHLKQVIYNPCTGGCYDGLEECQVNLNQGAESTVCYLMSRLVMEKYNSYW
jgi:glycosyltransferase involved in cell wall biosynthesis